jgi:hypothetical protein
MQWQAQRPKRVNFDSGIEYNRAVATWRAGDPSKMEAIVPRGTSTPRPTVTKPAIQRDITLPPKQQVVRDVPQPIPTPQPAPTKFIADQAPKRIISPSRLEEGIAIEEAKNVPIIPTKKFTPVSPAIMDLAPDVSGTPIPQPIIQPISETPPSEDDIEDVLQRTGQRAASEEEEARRQLFYRGQVKRRGGIRMLFGKYAFPSPRKLAPSTAEQLSSASKTVKKLVVGRLGGLVSPEKASYLKESKKEGYMGLGGEESPVFRG